jgi:FdrA protein
MTSSLTECVLKIAKTLNFSSSALRFPDVPSIQWASFQDKVVGLFCGGTLCAEAQLIMDNNHTFIDFGDDDYTKGRPHPMIDPTLRNDAFLHYGQLKTTAILLFDIVLGYGSHPDPAGNLSPILKQLNAQKTPPILIASVCGTELDHPTYSHQVHQLKQNNVIVAPSNAFAAQMATTLLTKRTVLHPC